MNKNRIYLLTEVLLDLSRLHALSAEHRPFSTADNLGPNVGESKIVQVVIGRRLTFKVCILGLLSSSIALCGLSKLSFFALRFSYHFYLIQILFYNLQGAFDYANSFLVNKGATILANADIFFDDSLSRIALSDTPIDMLLRGEVSSCTMGFVM